MAMVDEVQISIDGVDLVGLESDSTNVTWSLDKEPDFGVLSAAREKVDQGYLGQYSLGARRPSPRQVSFYLRGDCDPSITDKVARRRELRRAWRELAVVLPVDGEDHTMVVTQHDLATGADYTRTIDGEIPTLPSWRVVTSASPEQVGGRHGGYVRFFVGLDCNWPWFYGPEVTRAVATSSGTDTVTVGYNTAGDNAATVGAGWRLEIDSITGSPTEVTLTFDSGPAITIVNRTGGIIPADTVMDYFYADKQDWYSYQHDGAATPAATSWGDLQIKTGSGDGRFISGNTDCTITTDTGEVSGNLVFREPFQDVT